MRQLVGREEELASLVRLLEAELPWTAVVAGEAGIGKTALWLAARDEAAARGFRVLSARPSDAEAGFSFSGLADLLGPVLPEFLEELPAPQRQALDAALGRSKENEPVEEGRVAFGALAALRAIARAGPVLVAVDDVQWLDAPSLALLRYAIPRLEADAVGTLLTARGDVPAWLRREHPLELELHGLSLGATYELLRTRLDATFPRPVLLRIHEQSAGNPFFAVEIARALLRRGGRIEPGEEVPLPPSLEELLQERLDALGAPALETARVVAAIAEPRVELLEAVAGDGLEGAVAAGVLETEGERVRFTHPLFAAAVAARATPGQRRELHARLAEAVPSGEERARHLALAATGPSEDVAAALEEASEAARVRGAPAAAAELAEHALRLTPDADPDSRTRRSVLAANRVSDAGDTGRAVAILQEALAHAPTGPRRARLLLSLAETTWAVEGPHAALLLLEQALHEGQGDAVLEARAHFRLADLMRFAAAGSIERGVRHAELAVEASARAGDPELRCQALSMLVLQRFVAGLADAVDGLDEALALERSLGRRLGEASWARGHVLTWSGADLDAARSFLEPHRHAMRATDDLQEGHFLWWLALVEWRAGNWERAERHAEELMALNAQSGQPAPRLIAEFATVLIAASRGDVAQTQEICSAAIDHAEELGMPAPEALHSWALGFVALSRGDSHAALPPLRRASDIWDGLGYFEPGHRLELTDTIEALIGVGELEDAALSLARRDETARRLDRAWAIANLARCRGLLLAARGDFSGAFASFDEALAQHARVLHPLERGRTLLALGTTQRRAKKRAAARASLEEALSAFDRLGARLWAERARDELGRIGGRTAAGQELTEAEQRIATLVAAGRPNREVAAALFLTEHTVETALTRIYRKLGVRSRTELAHRLGQDGSKT